MKCLKTISGSVMESRYPDKVAAAMVASGNYVYCAKREWKEKVRAPKQEAAKNATKKKAITKKKIQSKTTKENN